MHNLYYIKSNLMFVFIEIGNTISNLFGGSSKVEESVELQEDQKDEVGLSDLVNYCCGCSVNLPIYVFFSLHEQYLFIYLCTVSVLSFSLESVNVAFIYSLNFLIS